MLTIPVQQISREVRDNPSSFTAAIKQDLSDAGAVLKRVKTSIHALPQPRTEQITEMVNQGKQVVDQIDGTFDTLNTIVEKIPG